MCVLDDVRFLVSLLLDVADRGRRRELLHVLDRRRRGDVDLRVELVRDELRDRRLSDAARSADQCVIELALAAASSVDRDPEVVDHVRLSDELGERPRTVTVQG